MPKKQFGTKPFKPGELKLLTTMWNLQSPDFFKKPVQRQPLLDAAKWTSGQFSAYFNDLRVRSKSHYIEGGKTYRLMVAKLLHRPRSAKILLLFEKFTTENKKQWPDGEVPQDSFLGWFKSLSETPVEIALEVIRTSVKRFYLTENIVEGTTYLSKADRFEIEKEWINFLVKQEG